MKQNLIETLKEKHKFTLIAGDFNTVLSTTDRTTRQNGSKEEKS